MLTYDQEHAKNEQPIRGPQIILSDDEEMSSITESEESDSSPIVYKREPQENPEAKSIMTTGSVNRVIQKT